MKNFNNKKGFTLVELLVAITIFASFIAVLSGSYLNLTRAQRDTNELRKVYSEGRFLIDEMISTIRGSGIAYDCYADANADIDDTCDGSNRILDVLEGTTLALSIADDKRVVYRTECDDNGCDLKKIVQKFETFGDLSDGEWMASHEDGYTGFQTLNLEKIEIERAYFVITPGAEDSRLSPTVSIYLSLSGTSQLRDAVNFDVQTTVSLRDY